jgi:hypothetical protein
MYVCNILAKITSQQEKKIQKIFLALIVIIFVKKLKKKFLVPYQN